MKKAISTHKHVIGEIITKRNEKIDKKMKLLILIILIYLIWFAFDWTLNVVILNKELSFITWVFSAVIIIPGLMYIIRDDIIEGRYFKWLGEIKIYFKDTPPFITYAISYILALLFFYHFSLNIQTVMMPLTQIYFTLAGFSFTAASFSRRGEKNNTLKEDFFRTSFLFLLLGFLNLIYILFYPILSSNLNNLFYAILSVIYPMILAFLFTASFIKLFTLLLKR